MRKITLTLLSAVWALGVFAQQQQRVCGTMQHHQYLLQTRPNYAADLAQYNQMIQQYLSNPQNTQQRINTTITIPVVIHVVYNTAAQNISDAQAISQLTVLNNDFQKLNSDTNLVPSIFKSRAGGVSFTFCLAQRDPSGNATTGVIHKSTTVTSFSTDDKVKSTAQGGDDAWDVTRYMNIWICPLASPLLGYGEFPTASLSNTYGLVINYTAAGTSGTATAPYNKGRTGTHEFGHCFNLIHIWGDDNGACTGDDQCADTPNQKDMNYGTPTYPQGTSASGGCCTASDVSSMYMNYMDYVDDAAMFIFTQNQCARMLAVVTTAPWNVLQSSNGCTPLTSYALDASMLNVITPANGTSSCTNSVTPKVVLANTGTVTLTSATINYKMDAGTNQVYNWTGSLAPSASTTVTLNSFTGLTTASHTFSVSVTSPNGGTDQNASNNVQTSTFTVSSAPTTTAVPFREGFEGTTFVPTGWVKTSVNTLNAANTWTRVANTTGIPVTPASTACAKMDNYSGNTDITGQRDALMTPAMSFAAANSTLKLKFDVSYRVYSTTTNDSLNVWISTDCSGSNWTRIYNKGGASLATVSGALTSAYTPTANAQWRRDSVSLSSYAGQPVVFVKFESVSAYGNNVYLDNINIDYVSSSSAPTASFATAASTVCTGTSLQLTDQSTNSPTSWAWSSASSTGVSFSSSTAQNPTVTFSNAGTYTLSLVATNTGGSNTFTKTVTVNATPNVVVNTASICQGNAVTLTASGASTYSWSTSATTATVSVNPSATTVYTVTGTTSGCAKTMTTSVTVTPMPTVTVNSATICSGQTATFTAGGATTYSWNTGATSANLSVSPTASTNYTVTGTTSGCSKTMTTSVTVKTTPTVTANNSTICQGNSANLTASGASGYSWSTGSGASSISVSPSTTTSYTVTGTTNGCSGTAVSTVSVNPVPAVTVNSSTICTGGTANLSASGATTYTWSTGSNASSISVTPSSTTSYTVTGSSSGCTSNAMVTTVVVNSAPSIAVNSSTICAGGSANLSASGVNTYTWSSGSNASNISVSPASTTVYTVSGNASGCTSTAINTATVVVNPLPVVFLSPIGGPLCTSSPVVALNGSPSGGTYSGTGVSGSNFDPSMAGSGTFTITYNYTDANSCAGVDSKTVSVNSCTGINEQTAASTSVIVYPNPVKDLLYVKLENINSRVVIEVYDAIGKQVFAAESDQPMININTADFAKGLYTLRVKTSDNKQTISRFIKE